MRGLSLVLVSFALGQVQLPGSALPSDYAGLDVAASSLDDLPANSENEPVANSEIEVFEDFPPDTEATPTQVPTATETATETSAVETTTTATEAAAPTGDADIPVNDSEATPIEETVSSSSEPTTEPTTSANTEPTATVEVTVSEYTATKTIAPTGTSATPLCHKVYRRHLQKRAVRIQQQ